MTRHPSDNGRSGRETLVHRKSVDGGCGPGLQTGSADLSYRFGIAGRFASPKPECGGLGGNRPARIDFSDIESIGRELGVLTDSETVKQ